MPGVLLGFHPRESCVILGVADGTVEFCARADLEWLPSGIPDLLLQLVSAIDQSQVDSLAVLAYCEDPLRHEAVLRLLIHELRDWVVLGLVAQEHQFWDLLGPSLLQQDPIPWDPLSSQVLAAAVYQGVTVASDRDTAVSQVRGPEQPELVEYSTEVARQHVNSLEDAEREALLKQLLHSEETLVEVEAAELALLVQDPELSSLVLGLLDAGACSGFVERLAEARRSVADDEAGEVLALLALSCWMDSRGAQLAECLVQLERIAPWHPLFPVVVELHRRATPPPHPDRVPPWK